MRIVSKAVRDAARGQECTLRLTGICNGDRDTVVLAHLPCGHKGTGMKGPDSVSAFLCAACHSHVDGPERWSVEAQDYLRAIAETHQVLFAMGIFKIKGAA